MATTKTEASLEEAIERALKDLLKKRELNDKDKLRLDALNTAIKLLAVQKRGEGDDGWGDALREPSNGTEA